MDVVVSEMFGFAIVCRLHKLERLDIGWCQRITSTGFSQVRRLRKLNHVNLYGCDIDAGVDNLFLLTDLKVLHGCRDIGDAGCSHISQCKTLEELYLDHCTITDLTLIKICRLRNLRTLHVAHCSRITDVGFSDIANMLQLENLLVEVDGQNLW